MEFHLESSSVGSLVHQTSVAYTVDTCKYPQVYPCKQRAWRNTVCSGHLLQSGSLQSTELSISSPKALWPMLWGWAGPLDFQWKKKNNNNNKSTLFVLVIWTKLNTTNPLYLLLIWTVWSLGISPCLCCKTQHVRNPHQKWPIAVLFVSSEFLA